MSKELLNALDALETEKGIKKEVIIDALEQALVSAYKKNYGQAQNVKVTFDARRGDIKVFAVKEVVNEVLDSCLEVSLSDALEINRAYEIGDTIDFEVTPRDFGRIAAQTAKQVIMQRVREEERQMIYNQYKESIRDILKTLCGYKGVEILEGHLMPDHIHMLVSIPPKISVSSFMGYLKGKSALMIFDKHANLKYKFGNRHFWAEGYYVSTVGLNEATIKKYIQEQEKHDIAMDKLSVKEYEDPFKG